MLRISPHHTDQTCLSNGRHNNNKVTSTSCKSAGEPNAHRPARRTVTYCLMFLTKIHVWLEPARDNCSTALDNEWRLSKLQKKHNFPERIIHTSAFESLTAANVPNKNYRWKPDAIKRGMSWYAMNIHLPSNLLPSDIANLRCHPTPINLHSYLYSLVVIQKGPICTDGRTLKDIHLMKNVLDSAYSLW